MTMCRRMAAGLAVAAVAVGSSVAAWQGVTLRYRWTPGETLRYRITQEVQTTLSGLPGGMPDVTLDQTITQTFRMVAKDVTADGTTTMEQVIEAIQMEMNTPAGKITYDSAKPSAAPGNPLEAMMSKMFTPMVGTPFTVTQSSLGIVQKVEGMTKAAEKMLSGLPSDPQMDQMLSGLKASLTDDAMKGMFAQGFAQLPEQVVKPGDGWKGTLNLPNPALGTTSIGVASTLQSVDGSGDAQTAKIVNKVTITQTGDSPGNLPMGMVVKLGDASGDGEIAFDVAKGRTRRAVTHLTMPMTMSGSAPDGTTISMRNNAKSTITIELMP
jgi:hypothetical protein